MTLLFLLKKNYEGISSGEIGVRSPIKMTLELRFPKLDCNNVNEVIGEPISVDGCCSTVLAADVAGIEGDVSYPFFIKASI
jgi:riboflavin synthase alpha subunit